MGLNKYSALLLQLFALLLFIAIFILVNSNYRNIKESAVVKEVRLDIADSLNLSFATREYIDTLLNDLIESSIGMKIESAPVHEIEQLLKGDKYINSANAYVVLSGVINVAIEQFKPLVRIISSDGRSFYADSRGRVVPQKLTSYIDLPIVTLESDIITFDNSDEALATDKGLKEAEIMRRIVEFATYLKGEDTYDELFTQINISEKGEVELFPRIGSHYVVFSTLDSLGSHKRLLAKLDKFYKSQSSKGVWSDYSIVNLKFDGQVVCTRQKKR